MKGSDLYMHFIDRLIILMQLMSSRFHWFEAVPPMLQVQKLTEDVMLSCQYVRKIVGAKVQQRINFFFCRV